MNPATLPDGDTFADPTGEAAARHLDAGPHGDCEGCGSTLALLDQCGHCELDEFDDQPQGVLVGGVCSICGQRGRVRVRWCAACRYSPDLAEQDVPPHLAHVLR